MWAIDSTIDAANDMVSVFYKAEFHSESEEARKSGLEKFFNDVLPKWCERMEKRLKENVS